MITVEITGIIHRMFDPSTSVSGFTKRIIHLAEAIEGRQTFQIEAHNQMVDELEDFHSGDRVKCQIELQGREWERQGQPTTVFNTLRLYKIEKV